MIDRQPNAAISDLGQHLNRLLRIVMSEPVGVVGEQHGTEGREAGGSGSRTLRVLSMNVQLHNYLYYCDPRRSPPARP